MIIVQGVAKNGGYVKRTITSSFINYNIYENQKKRSLNHGPTIRKNGDFLSLSSFILNESSSGKNLPLVCGQSLV